MNEIKVDPKIDDSWKEKLENEFKKEYFHELKKFLIHEKKQQVVYPPGKEIFQAFNLTPFEKVKVVIIGQDPYHGPGQAEGLCFSVKKGVKKPPSLLNIFKEIKTDLGHEIPENGSLVKWSRQGVLLLNAVLTVRAHQAASHRNKGWEFFTDAAINSVSRNLNNVVFILWGSYAKEKEHLIDKSKHHILNSPHPSPLSAHRGFMGCGHFGKCNTYLASKKKEPIDWRIE